MDLEIRKLVEIMPQLLRQWEKETKHTTAIKCFGFFMIMLLRLEPWTYLYSGRMNKEKMNLLLLHLMEQYYQVLRDPALYKCQENLKNLR